MSKRTAAGLFSFIVVFASFLSSASSAHADITSNLLRHFTLDDAAASTAVIDATGSGNGTANVNTSVIHTSSAAIGTGAFVLNGTTQYANTNYKWPSSYNAVTISAWFKYANSTDNWNIVNDYNGQPGIIGINTNVGGRLSFSAYDTSGHSMTAQTSAAYNDGNWHMVTAVVSGTAAYLYIDAGAPATASNASFTGVMSGTGTNTFLIGSQWNPVRQGLPGSIDDVCIYNRALSSSDITQLYNSPTGCSVPAAPAISSIAATTTQTTAAITWTTDQSASSTVAYGSTSGYGYASTTNALVASHQIILSGLSPSTTYHYQVASGNSSGLVATSSDYTFTTLSVDTTPPAISAVNSTASLTAAAITWITDESADSKALYGTVSGAYTSSTSTPALTTSHSLSVSGLTASTTYYYVLVSADTSGNAATTSEQAFTTSAVPDTTPPSIPTGLSAAAVSSSEIDLSWSASTDANGVAGYSIYRNGMQIGTSTLTAYSDATGLSAFTQYSYTVSAYDTANNMSAQSSSASTSTLPTGTLRTLTIYKYEHAGQGTVTATVNGQQIINCGASCSASVPVGATITFTATPSATSTLSRWEDCPGATSTTCTIAMPDWNMSMGAVFTSPGFTPMSSLSDIISYATSHGGLTWVFTGDSFSTLQTYTVYFESYFQLHYPNLHFHFRNMARGGSTIGDLTDDPTLNPHRDPVTGNPVNFNVDSRFDRAVYALSPDIVSVEFTDNGHPSQQQLHDAVEGFIQDYVIPNHSNPVVLGAWPTNNVSDLVATTSYMKTLYDADEQVGQELGIPAGTDWYSMAPMMLANLSSTTPVNLNGLQNNDDKEHLNEAGALAASSYILADLGADSDVSSVAIDAGAGSLVSQSHATTTEVTKNAYHGVDFVRKDDRLPMAFDDLSRPVLEIDPQVLDMNRYMLTVSNLYPGMYDVYIDGVKSATVDSATLASGWNMTAMTQGPIYDQLVDVVTKIRNKEGVSQNRLYGPEQQSDPTDSCVPAGYNWWGDANYASNSGYYDDPGYRGDFLASQLASVKTQLACLDDRIHAAAQPVARTFSIRLSSNGDATAPVISAAASSVTPDAATVSWTTDENADSALSYGTVSGAYTSSTSTAALAMSHSLNVSGLTASTTYYYVVTSADIFGNTATSSEQTFVTAPALDVIPPVISSVDATSTDTTAVITWTTDEDASSAINFGTDPGYGSASSSAGFGTDHSIALAGLNPSTAYHFQVISTDLAGNSATSSDMVFTTPAAPDITAPVVTSISASTAYASATISWNTDEGSDSSVLLGTASGSYTISTSSPVLTNSHLIDLAGLSASTTYYYVVSSTDASGNTATSSEQTFATPIAPDTTAPAISLIASSTGETTATITWTTDEAASSTVEYGASDSYGTASSSDSFGTSHSIILTGLSSGTVYHFRVSSSDTSGNLSTSSDSTFTTSAPAAPQVISSIATSTTATTATIAWMTGGGTTGATSARHSIMLTGLSPSTAYQFNVVYDDQLGNAATSTDVTFTTTP